MISLKENIRHAHKIGLYSNDKKIKIINKKDNYEKIFDNMDKASLEIGHNHGYISGKIKKGIYENKNYIWKLI